MIRRLSTCFMLLVFSAVFPGEIRGESPIASGCSVPKPSTGRAFYIDPVNGNMSNDGSADRPWRTLAEVLDSQRKLIATQAYSENYQKSDQRLSEQNSSAPIKPGDIIYLKSGDHGNVDLARAINSEFITVQAVSGQIPSLRSLRVNGASKWKFVGLKVQGAGDGSTSSRSGPALIELGRNLWFGPTSDIILSESSISTTDNSNLWTDLDWVKKPFVFGILSGATCVSITDNHFFNLRNAVQFDGQQHLVANNKIDNFGNDGIDIIASNAIVRNNRITHGRHTKSEPSHPDGIQGWTKNGATNANVLIDGNVIIKTGNPEVSEMQGIGIFDGTWNGLIISNNVVVTNHWHGITVNGATNTKIINNTVVAYSPSRPTWITVNIPKNGPRPENLIVRNNITTRLVYPETGVTVDHNIVAQRIDTAVSGKPVYISQPGKYGNNNTVDPNIYDTLLRVDHAKETYDLRLKSNSPAIGRGNAEQAPKVDILGKQRRPPIDVGAYAR